MFVECACQKWNQNSLYSCSTRCIAALRASRVGLRYTGLTLVLLLDSIHNIRGRWKKIAPTATKKERGEEAPMPRTVRGLPQRWSHQSLICACESSWHFGARWEGRGEGFAPKDKRWLLRCRTVLGKPTSRLLSLLVLVATRLFAIELRRCRRRSTKFWH